MIKEFVSPQCDDWGASYHEPCLNIQGLWVLFDLYEFLQEWEDRPGCTWHWTNSDNAPWGFRFVLLGDEDSILIATLTWNERWGQPC